MYIPKINLETDRNEIVSFMQRFSFATIITAKNNLPIATHLPFLVTTKEDNVILAAHFAKANEHWKEIENAEVLVIFSEPHAYISPVHYEKELSVPTWNYVSVHVYGKARLIPEKPGAFRVLESTIDYYDPSYRKQWDNLPEEYKLKMINGIVAFEIVATDLQAKKKLSQNRTVTEQQKIIESLSTSNDSNEQLIAEYMAKSQGK